MPHLWVPFEISQNAGIASQCFFHLGLSSFKISVYEISIKLVKNVTQWKPIVGSPVMPRFTSDIFTLYKAREHQ